MKVSDFAVICLLFIGVYVFMYTVGDEVDRLRDRLYAAEEHINDLAIIIAENVDEKAAQDLSEEKEQP